MFIFVLPLYFIGAILPRKYYQKHIILDELLWSETENFERNIIDNFDSEFIK